MQPLEAVEHDAFVMVVDNADVAREKLAEADALLIDESFAALSPADVVEASERRGGVCQLPVLLVTSAFAIDPAALRPTSPQGSRPRRS